MKWIINGVTMECIAGDIAGQDDIVAVVNAANARLLPGGGVAGALHRAAGPGLAEECLIKAPIKPGEAVITGGHNLPNRYVIHTLGPVYDRDEPAAKLLARCYSNSLLLADEHRISSIAFPAISTGIFGYPIADAAAVAAETIAATIPQLKHVRLIRMVLYSDGDLRVFEEIFGKQL